MVYHGLAIAFTLHVLPIFIGFDFEYQRNLRKINNAVDIDFKFFSLTTKS